MGPTLFDKRFIIVAGKGGVGKSVVCAAIGHAAAARGLRTCIAELNTREKAPLFFGRSPHGYRYGELAPNLFSINIQPEPALREYGLMKLRFEKLFELVFENEAMRRLVRVIPGMNELFLLGKAFNMERERGRDGRPVWDLVIVDAPATGHGVSLLRLPETILKVADSGPMREEVGAMRDLLVDPRRTLLNLVTLPEEMPVRETFELAAQTSTALGIPKGYLVVNGVWPRFASDADVRLGAALADLLPPDATASRAALESLASMHRRRDFQDGHIADLRQNLAWPFVELPYLFSARFDAATIAELAAILVPQLSGTQPATLAAAPDAPWSSA